MSLNLFLCHEYPPIVIDPVDAKYAIPTSRSLISEFFIKTLFIFALLPIVLIPERSPSVRRPPPGGPDRTQSSMVRLFNCPIPEAVELINIALLPLLAPVWIFIPINETFLFGVSVQLLVRSEKSI